jgi:hypothetical protein
MVKVDSLGRQNRYIFRKGFAASAGRRSPLALHAPFRPSLGDPSATTALICTDSPPAGT